MKPKWPSMAKPICARPTRSPTRCAPGRHRCKAKDKVKDHFIPEGAEAEGRPGPKVRSATVLQEARSQDRARQHPEDRQSRIDGRDLDHRAPDRKRKSAFCRAPTARRCSPAVKPRPRRCHARHRRRRAVHRRWKAPTRALHAALQLPALLGR
jgi:hypothetical protein